VKRIEYNSPVILTFSLIAVVLRLADAVLANEISISWFAIGSTISFTNPADYFRLVSHVLGHSGWRHLFNNLTFILLLGPILEEKYGSVTILEMIVITAVITGVVNVIFFPTGLMGASGIVFMLIILASIVDIKKGTIPMTFILVAGIFIGMEIFKMFREDQISQMAHIIGGTMGAAFGFIMARPDVKTEDRKPANSKWR
jgi:membrane associated rhomboid family serine protease